MKMGKVPILDTINKVPGGLMVIPLFCGVLCNTFIPEFLQIGSFTTGLFKSGANAVLGILFVCSGAQITLQTAGQSLYKGIVLNTTKVLFGVSLGCILAAVGGPEAVVLGMTPLAMIGCMSNSNGGLYTALASKYGCKSDVGAVAVISSNDGPFFEMLFMGLSGVANIPFKYLVACIFPIILGMVLGNLDEKLRDFLKPGVLLSILFFSFPLGAGMNLQQLIVGGLPGILLGALTIIWTGGAGFIAYRLLVARKNRRSCAVGAAIGTSAGNSVATPAAIAAADPAWEPYVATATAQCAASIMITAILTPLVVSTIYKYEDKHGYINYDVPLASEED